MADIDEKLTSLTLMMMRLELQLKGHLILLVRLSSELPAVVGRPYSGCEIAEQNYSCSVKAAIKLQSDIAKIKDRILNLTQSNCLPKIDIARAVEEQRAIKEASVTSLTYERAQKILIKSVDGFLSN